MKMPFSKADLFFWPVGLLGAASVLAVAVSALSLVQQFDHASLQREQTVVAHGISDRVAEVAAMVVPQAMWDDAVRNLDNRFDSAWAANNIGKFLG